MPKVLGAVPPMEAYGFAPRAAINGAAFQKVVERGASPDELIDLREEMMMTRMATDAAKRAEFWEAFRAAGVTGIFQNAGEEGNDPLRLLKRLSRFTYTTDLMRDVMPNRTRSRPPLHRIRLSRARRQCVRRHAIHRRQLFSTPLICKGQLNRSAGGTNLNELTSAIERALAIGAIAGDAVRLLLQGQREEPTRWFRLDGRPHLAAVHVPTPNLQQYALLCEPCEASMADEPCRFQGLRAESHQQPAKGSQFGRPSPNSQPVPDFAFLIMNPFGNRRLAPGTAKNGRNNDSQRGRNRMASSLAPAGCTNQPS